jgi:hypothetical protein
MELRVEVQDEGLLVVLRVRDAADDGTSPREFTAVDAGTTTLAVPPGEYQVAIRDEHFGWGGEDVGSVTIHDSGSAKLTVERSLAASLKPLTEIEAPATEDAQSPQLRFLWNGQRYMLTPGQASAVQKLVDALLAGQPDTTDGEIVGSIPRAPIVSRGSRPTLRQPRPKEVRHEPPRDIDARILERDAADGNRRSVDESRRPQQTNPRCPTQG